MEVIINFVKGIPLLLLIAVPSAIVLILLLTIILVSVIKKNAFIARLKKVIEKPDSLNELIKSM
jgi:hypothetical protein